MPEAHTTIAMIATVMLLWGLSVALRGLGGRLPRLGRRARKSVPARATPARPVSIPVTVFGALVAAGSAPVFWTAGQVYRWVRSVDPMVAPFTIWTGVALGCVAFGAALVAAGFRGDRPKGRKRCPGCWYDMSGAPGLTCPECGREMEGAADLLRPRRNRRMIAAGLALTLLAIVPYYTPRVQRGGWVAAVPTTAFVLGLPWWPDSAITGGGGNTDDWSLLSRIEEEAVHAWQLRLLRGRADAGSAGKLARIGMELDDEAMLQRAVSELLGAATAPGADDVEALQLLATATEALQQLEWSDSDSAPVVDPFVAALAPMLVEEDGYLALPAVKVLNFASDLTPALDNLISMFTAPVDWELPEENRNFTLYQSPQLHSASALGVAADEHAAAREVLLSALEGELSPVHQAAALMSMRWRHSRFDGLGEALVARLIDPATTDAAAAALSYRLPYHEAAAEALAEAICSSESPHKDLVSTALLLAKRGHDPAGGLSAILHHSRDSIRFAVALAMGEAHSAAPWDRDLLLETLREFRSHPSTSSAMAGRIDDAIADLEGRW